MNKQTDAIFDRMMGKYANEPSTTEITPEIMEEIKTEVLKARFIEDLKKTIAELEISFKYKKIGNEPKKSVKVKVSRKNFDRETKGPTFLNPEFESCMKNTNTIYRCRLDVNLPNYKPGSYIYIKCPEIDQNYPEFGKYFPDRFTTVIDLKHKNSFPEEVNVEYEFIGKESYEIMIELHKQEIERLESEIKKF